MDREKLDQFPVLPLRDIVLFPNMIVPLYVGRRKSINSITQAQKGRQVLLIAQKNAADENPKASGLYRVGVLGNVLQVLKLQDSLKILVEGGQPVKVLRYQDSEEVLRATVKPLIIKKVKDTQDIAPLRRSLLDKFEEYIQLSKKLSHDVFLNIKSIDDINKFADIIAAQATLNVEEKQQILEQTSVLAKLELLLEVLSEEVQALSTEHKIKSRVKNQIDKNQKDYLLNEQLKAIYKELGEEDTKDELYNLEKKLKALKLEKPAKEKVSAELKKLKVMNPMSSEASVIRTYLDWFVELPWKVYSTTNMNLQKAEEILNQDHFGLEKIKERILEYLAVSLKTDHLKSPILCLVGPPGVGKTSLGQSVAKATNREFVKISLGGLRDEAEIKGHRRTYIGAMPGKIIQALKKAKTNNPVILLDEIDKLGNDFRGDPSSALLEVLDPEQNYMFNDHYMEVDIDLSKVLFIATANSFKIPRPLLDRMEVVDLSSYTEEEKLMIGRDYLVPKQIANHGTNAQEIQFTEEAIREIIQFYTKEAGVRNLNRELAKIIRKIIRELLVDAKNEIARPVLVTPSILEKYLGVQKYNYLELNKSNLIGVVNGLAYTEVGGDILAIEVVKSFGKGNFQVTGKLGEVMKESVHAAISYIKSKSAEFGIQPNVFKNIDIHVHVPEGAVPKDGPSAGITMFTALVSVLTDIPVRRDVAMTGEITLRGRVLAIGGLKEKLLAALRAKVTKVLIPKENEKDLKELANNIKDGLEIIPVESAEEVLTHALMRMPDRIEWSLEQALKKADAFEESRRTQETEFSKH